MIQALCRSSSLFWHGKAPLFWPRHWVRRAYSINKVVRDNIPDIITSSGRICETTILSQKRCIKALQDKFHEEVEELKKADSEENWLEELADIEEIVRALLREKGYSYEELSEVRLKKHEEKGGFKKRVFLKHIQHQKRDKASS